MERCRSNQQGTFDRIALAAADTPCTEENSTSDGDTDQGSIDITNPRKLGDSPEKVD